MKKIIGALMTAVLTVLFILCGNKSYASSADIASISITMTMLDDAHSRLLYDVYWTIPEESDEVLDSITIKTMNTNTSDVKARSGGISEITASEINDSLTIKLMEAISGGESVHLKFSYEAILFSVSGNKVILDFTQALPSSVSVQNFTFRLSANVAYSSLKCYSDCSISKEDNYTVVNVENLKKNPSFRITYTSKYLFTSINTSEAVKLRYRMPRSVQLMLETIPAAILLFAGLPLLIVHLVSRDRKRRGSKFEKVYLKDVIAAREKEKEQNQFEPDKKEFEINKEDF